MDLLKTEPLGKTFAFLTRSYVGALAEQLKELEIERHFYVLYRIDQSADKMTQKCLCDILGQDKTSMVRIVDYLAAKGFVERVQNASDRREQFVTLTDKAKKYVPLIKQVYKRLNETALKGLSEQEINQFFATIAAIEKNLKSLPATAVKIDYKPKK